MNLCLVAGADPVLWAWFMAIFPIASKLILVTIQYVTTRVITIGRLRAAGLYPLRQAEVGPAEACQ